MKKTYISTIKNAIKRIIYTVGIIAACYGFWGSLFPDLTLLEGTYRIVGNEDERGTFDELDAETLYAELLEGKYRVTYSSRIWEIIRNKFGQ